MRRLLPLLLILFLASPAAAQTMPPLTGRIVDQANLLPPDREGALSARLEQLERDTSRQLVVVTVPDLQGYSVEDFGFALGEQWKIGDKEADNGAILLIAPTERKMRIEVGDGLEPILPDALAHIIIRDAITPKFKAGDMVGGIEAGADAVAQQLRAPPEVAEEKALEAQRRQQQQSRSRARSANGFSFLPMIFWGMVILFVLLSMFRGRGRRGRRGPWGGRRYGGSDLPIMLWALGSALESRHRSSRGWGGGFGGFGGGGGGGGGFGGFSGGGGSFGGGGASGSW